MAPKQAEELIWTAEAFLATDQAEFGPAWRYELVNGQIVAHAAPAPDHGVITANLARLIGNALRRHSIPCRTELGTGATPKRQQRNTARISDISVRCGEHLRVLAEIISPSELRKWRERDEKRRDLQDVESVQEIIEIYQLEYAAHIYRRTAAGTWSFDAIGGKEAKLSFDSVGIELPLDEIYEGSDFDSD